MLQLTAQRETIPVVAVRVAVLQEVCHAVAIRVAVAVRPAHILPAHHRAVLRAAQAHSLREVAAVVVQAGRSVAVEAAVVRAAVVAAVQVVDADNSKLRTKT